MGPPKECSTSLIGRASVRLDQSTRAESAPPGPHLRASLHGNGCPSREGAVRSAHRRTRFRLGAASVRAWEVAVPQLHLAQDARADALLSRDSFALLVGMLLDQQIPMERAFAGPRVLAERLGSPEGLDPKTVASLDPEELASIMSTPPAVHRFPGSMASRVHAVARAVVDQYGGDAESLWRTA